MNTTNFPKYANERGWSQTYPFEIVKVISPTTLEIRAMDHERDPNWVPEFIPGGFAAHCTNQHAQTWFYKSNLNARPIRIRLNKKGQWVHKGRRFNLADAPKYFYDYNF